MSFLSSFAKTAVRGVAAVYTGGASEALYYRPRDAEKASVAQALADNQRYSMSAFTPQTRMPGNFNRLYGEFDDYEEARGKVVKPGAGSVVDRIKKAVTRRATTAGGAPRRRMRSRGITGREFKAFRRVSAVLDKYCKVKAPTQKARRVTHRRK